MTTTTIDTEHSSLRDNLFPSASCIFDIGKGGEEDIKKARNPGNEIVSENNKIARLALIYPWSNLVTREKQ